MTLRRWMIPAAYMATCVAAGLSLPYWERHHYWNRAHASRATLIILPIVGVIALSIFAGFQRSRRSGWIVLVSWALVIAGLGAWSLYMYFASKVPL